VDTYETEAKYFKPGMPVTVSLPHGNRSFTARVAKIPPQFDPGSRTLKVRLEADNPGYQLRPEMFVDVELPMQTQETVSVPVEALLDSGLKKTVFIEKKPGIFEPREVKTGRNFGNRTEIVSGLDQGERIVVSGTFLIDSESKMKLAAAGITSTPRQDPICNMSVDEVKARAKDLVLENGGTTWYFCSPGCKEKFQAKSAVKQVKQTQPKSPGTRMVAEATAGGHGNKPAKKTSISAGKQMNGSPAGITTATHQDPICNMSVDEAKARAKDLFLDQGGTTWYFCSAGCKEQFLDRPPDQTMQGIKKTSMSDMKKMKSAEHMHD
jgi:YHS domain-containing protein